MTGSGDEAEQDPQPHWDPAKMEQMLQKLAELQTDELERRRRDPPAPAPATVKLKPPTFSGEGGQDVETFLTRFGRVATHNGWTGEARLLQLQEALTGKAQLCAQQDTETKVEATLRAMFAMTARDARQALATLRFTEGDSVDAHAHRVKTLINRAYGDTGINAPALTSLTLESFLGSLGCGRLRIHLAALKPKTIDEAVEGTRTYLACLPTARGGPPAARSCDCEDARTGTPGPEARDQSLRSPTPVLPGAAGEGTAVMAAASSTPDLAGLVKELITALNAQNGTLARPREVEDRGGRPRGRRRSDDRPLVCWLCGQAGHYARACPRRHLESLAPRERGQAPK